MGASSRRSLHDVDLNLFKVLDAVYTHRGITPAAEALFVTQPAVSHALTRLREVFDDALFVRQGNRMNPTPRARAVIDEVRAHLQGLQQTLRSNDRFEPGEIDCLLKLGARDALESIVFAPLLHRLEVEAPRVRIESQRINPATMERDLTRGQLDLALDVARPVGDSIHSERLCDEPLVVAHRKGQKYFRQGLSLEAYAAARHVLVTLSPEGPEVVDLVLARLDVRRNVHLRCQHYFAACQVVAATDCLITLPFSIASILAEHLPLMIRPAPFHIPSLEIRLYWHSRVHEEPVSRWLREVIRDTVLEHLPDRARLAKGC